MAQARGRFLGDLIGVEIPQGLTAAKDVIVPPSGHDFAQIHNLGVPVQYAPLGKNATSMKEYYHLLGDLLQITRVIVAKAVAHALAPRLMKTVSTAASVAGSLAQRIVPLRAVLRDVHDLAEAVAETAGKGPGRNTAGVAPRHIV